MNEPNPTRRALNRATATFDALRDHRLYARRRGLFGTRPWWTFQRRYETLWPFADAWSALCSLGSLPGQGAALEVLEAMRRGLHSYGNQSDSAGHEGDAGFESVVTPPLGSGGDRYYDDNAWLGLALVHHHKLTGDAELLLLAQRLFAFVSSGWSDDNTWAVPGGIRWKEPTTNRSRNTCANGPASELAARLYETSGNSSYLEWAIRIYDWTRVALVRPDGVYDDHIAPDGTRDRTVWSYNQGSMIGAGVLLHRLTGDRSYLHHSLDTASAYIERPAGPELMTQDPAFNAVLFRNLFLLDQERPNETYRSTALQYGSAMWTEKRLRWGLFEGNGSLLNNSAAMMQIYALLAGAEPHA